MEKPQWKRKVEVDPATGKMGMRQWLETKKKEKKPESKKLEKAPNKGPESKRPISPVFDVGLPGSEDWQDPIKNRSDGLDTDIKRIGLGKHAQIDQRDYGETRQHKYPQEDLRKDKRRQKLQIDEGIGNEAAG